MNEIGLCIQSPHDWENKAKLCEEGPISQGSWSLGHQSFTQIGICSLYNNFKIIIIIIIKLTKKSHKLHKCGVKKNGATSLRNKWENECGTF